MNTIGQLLQAKRHLKETPSEDEENQKLIARIDKVLIKEIRKLVDAVEDSQ